MYVPTPGTLSLAAQRAIRAPSIHNTQPWRFVLNRHVLEIHADRTRQLHVLDPRARQLMISCGGALYNARVAIAAAGYEAVVARFPDPDRPDLVAEVRIGGLRERPESRSLDRAIDDRRTNRREFAGDPVPAWLVSELERAARAEDGVLFPVTDPGHRAVVARLSALADDIERADPRYVDEITAWTTDDLRRHDGVQAASVPYAEAGAPAGDRDALPIRGFDVRGMGWLPTSSGSGADQTLLLLCSHDDQPQGWLQTGEALEHVWLKLTEHGFCASPLTQVIEVRETHDQLSEELGLSAKPQILLRVGRAPGTVATRRRPASEVTQNGR
jgi:hypothetical protein